MTQSPVAPLRRCLSESSRKILLDLARTVMPPGKRFRAPDQGCIDRYDDFFASQPRAAQLGLEVLIHVFNQYPRLFHGRSFAGLSSARRLELVRDLLAGSYSQRMLLRAITAPLKVAQYNDPALFEKVGAVYQTPPVNETPPPRHMSLAINAEELDDGERIEAEVVVVGSGAGGAVMAAELAEMGVAVVLLEEGDFHHRQHFNGRPVEMLQMMYRLMGATGTLGNTFIPVPFGCCVGGTTTINSGTCYRTPRRIFDKWHAELGLEQLSAEELAPHFAKVENILQVERGDPKYVGAIGDIIGRGADALGWTNHGPLARNAPDCDGQSFCAFGCPTDAKRSTNISYVPLALRYGANLLYRAHARRILTRQGRAVGIEARTRRGKKLTIRADAVVLSAGALMTPTLLLKNHLANRSGQVGRNLSIHPAVGVCALFPDDDVRGYCRIPQGYGLEQFHEDGILFEGAFVPLDLCAGSFTPVGPRFTEAMEQVEHMAYFGFLIEDSSRGRVTLGPGGMPMMSYFMNDDDVAKLKRGVELLAQVYLAAGCEGIFPMLPGFEEIHDMRDVERLRRTRLRARDFELTAHHPLGTCRMGLDPRSSVVGPDHECHEVPNLFIADGSSVPSSLGVNPQITIMAMATRAARFVAQRVEDQL